MADGLTRRDFGRTVGLSGLGLAGAGLLTGQAGTAHAAAASWRTTGTLGAGLSSFDSTMKAFMQARNISCGSLAVARKGKLVLARGYTWTTSTVLKTQPTSLFRIASLSKPITAAAILKLVQDGKLKLTDRLPDLLTLTPPSGKTLDPRLANVTVLRLLQHLGGWDSSVTTDPMFSDLTISRALGAALPVGQADIIRYASGLTLNHDPGSTYAYANYDYMLLGRIIEKVSGMPYATYVQQKILGPRGITRMRLGRTLKANAVTGEVPYVSQYSGKTVFDASAASVPAPYGSFSLENMAAHGGWLGSAVDLVRFAGIFDAASSVLTSTSISRAFAQPETGVNDGGWWYGCGWSVRNVTGGRNTWHTGSLPGTSTILVRRYDGLTWAALFNQRDDASGLSYSDIDSALHKAANAVTTWPTGDLYGTYL
ncbi:beta-lactamase family protein [Microtetraspora sp. AC03309]|uniref:serine hydrolase domain-containing protein n=1 Tax=Microtetraspora sp. AC03309 TaxID=2779376 RepID=UPI001E4F46F0|nr:serine hydrolase domain-containing protein [Microtetraspora sp. AC03309]MCC5576556.1 beta-lactamase family protein [Microtetraspora sp. AC03309]